MHTFTRSIQHAVRDFRTESLHWEDDVRALFDDVDRFLVTECMAGASANASVAQDVAGLKGLVEQQTEVLAALVNALTGPAGSTEVAQESSPAEPEFDPFERLQRAVAAAAEAN